MYHNHTCTVIIVLVLGLLLVRHKDCHLWILKSQSCRVFSFSYFFIISLLFSLPRKHDLYTKHYLPLFLEQIT